MILIYLLLIPIIGILLISSDIYNESNNIKVYYSKSVAFITSIINLIKHTKYNITIFQIIRLLLFILSYYYIKSPIKDILYSEYS